MNFKKILFIFLSVILFSGQCLSQWQPINGKQRFTTGLGVPAKDTGTTSIADTSMITIRPQDSTLWYKYKGIWKSTKSSGTGGTGIDTTAWHKGGDSSLTNNIIGTKANRSLYFILSDQYSLTALWSRGYWLLGPRPDSLVQQWISTSACQHHQSHRSHQPSSASAGCWLQFWLYWWSLGS